MRIVTTKQMREIDNRAINEYGIPGIMLMENAALQAYRILEQYYPSCNRILILAGFGNNGGDGFALARILHSALKDVEVLFFNNDNPLSHDAQTNFEIAKKLRIPITSIDGSINEQLLIIDALNKTHLVVDALFGTGLARPVENHFKTAIDVVNEYNESNEKRIPVVSLDIPSGISGDSGKILGSAIIASDTITFGYPKTGHFLFPGKMHAGRLHVVPISIPPDSAAMANVSAFTLSEKEASAMLKKRVPWGHKGTFGKIGVIAGSTGMTGAAELASLAALKSGAGVVTLAVPSSLNPIMENKLTEVITYPMEDCGNGSFSRGCIKDMCSFLGDKDVLAIGPGLGKSEDIFEILKHILSKYGIPIVIDADGLNHVSNNVDILKQYKGDVVVTPHPGEMSRLTGKPVDEIQSDPIAAAREFAGLTDVIVLLKGAATVVVNPKGDVYVNNSGNSGMATAGSGDVLTGLIAGLTAQRYDPFEAAVLGAFIHGLAGDEAAAIKGEDSILAGDILENVPHAIKKLRAYS